MVFYHQIWMFLIFAGSKGQKEYFLKIVILVQAAGAETNEGRAVEKVQKFIHTYRVMNLARNPLFGCLFENDAVKVFHVVKKQKSLIVKFSQRNLFF